MDIWHVLVCHGFLPRQHYRTAYFPIQGLVFAAIAHSQHSHLCLHNNYLSSPATLGENRQPQRKFQYYISAALPYSGDNILKKILHFLCTCIDISIWASITHPANVFFPPCTRFEYIASIFFQAEWMEVTAHASFCCSHAVCKISTKTIFPAWGHQLRREANYHKWPVKTPCTLHAEKLNGLLSVFSVA